MPTDINGLDIASDFVFSEQDVFQNFISVQTIPHKYNKQNNEKCS